jgi:hypothetical protein
VVRERFDRLKQAFSSKPIEFRQSTFDAFAALLADDQERAIAAAAEYRRSCEAEKRLAEPDERGRWRALARAECIGRLPYSN